MAKAAHDVVVIPFRPRTERGGKVVKSGKGGVGAIYLWKGCQSGGKRIHSSAELTFSQSPAYSGIRAGGACMKSGGVGPPKADKPRDTCLRAMHRQVQGQHKATYRTRGAGRSSHQDGILGSS